MSLPKVWFITGASAGLGRDMTEHVLAKGDIAVATLRKPEALNDLASKYDTSKLLVLKLDVTKPEEIKNAFAKVEVSFGRIDVVYNNAGYTSFGEIEGTPDEVARGVFEVNFWGSTNVATEAVRFFREVNKPGVGGRLLQVSSGTGHTSFPGFGYYGASKHALEGISEALSKELHPSWNIKLTIIQLGKFATRVLQPESMVTVPPHPAYTKVGATAEVQSAAYFQTKGGDSTKAVREIYKIAGDNTVPLRIPVGLDSLALMMDKLERLKADVENAQARCVDLT